MNQLLTCATKIVDRPIILMNMAGARLLQKSQMLRFDAASISRDRRHTTDKLASIRTCLMCERRSWKMLMFCSRYVTPTDEQLLLYPIHQVYPKQVWDKVLGVVWQQKTSCISHLQK